MAVDVMTRVEASQLLELSKLKENFPYYAAECLRIKSKSGAQLPLKLNRAQQYVHSRLEEQRSTTGKVRALVLKARQQGFSTYIGGRFYHAASLNHGRNVFILTHEQSATDNLFAMVTRFHDNTPARPTTGAANAKELLFPRLDSGYAVGTAGQKAVGRSKTVHLFHGSEVAFWPNAKDHFGGVVQAIPDLPDTEIILESTANGVGGEFHTRWQQAEAGIGDYIAIFVPWFWSKEYRRPVPKDFTLSDAKDEDAQYSEREYAAAHALDLEQMTWRRYKVAELGELLFMQEYPATAAEAFQVTGHDSFIKAGPLLRARKAVCDAVGPLIIGVDPSRYGNDRFEIAWRRGRKVLRLEGREKIDTVAAANWLKRIIDDDDPKKMFMDAGGGGAQIWDLLRSWGKKYEDACELVNFGDPAQRQEIISATGSIRPGPKNRRAEMWWRSRDWLSSTGGVDIPDNDAIQSDACGPSYRYDTTQHTLLESKDAMRARGLRSPDKWDAIALTFATDVYDEALAPGAEGRYAANAEVFSAPGGWMSL